MENRYGFSAEERESFQSAAKCATEASSAGAVSSTQMKKEPGFEPGKSSIRKRPMAGPSDDESTSAVVATLSADSNLISLQIDDETFEQLINSAAYMTITSKKELENNLIHAEKELKKKSEHSFDPVSSSPLLSEPSSSSLKKEYKHDDDCTLCKPSV